MYKFLCACLIIVPLMTAQTTLQFVDWGASQRVCCVAADAAGNIYVAGDFLEPAPGNPQQLLRKAAVTKFDRENRVVYTFSFPGRQSPNAIAVNARGEVFLAGSADATDFPTVNPLPAPAASFSGDAFLSKLDASGTKLLSSSVIGRSAIYAIALDADGNVVVAGSTSASDFPVTPGAYQRSGPRFDGFGTPAYAVIARISTDGRRWMHSTFLGDGHSSCSGGSVCLGKFGNTAATSIAIGADGAIQIAGGTSTDRFPTTAGAFQPSARFSRPQPSIALPVGFITRFKPDLSALEWSTYFGNADPLTPTSTSTDSIGALALATDGSVFIAGFAVSRDFPVTEGAFATTRPPFEYRDNSRRYAYAARFSSTGSLLFATYLAGPVDGYGLGLSAGPGDRLWITAQMLSASGPLLNVRGNAVLFELASDGRRALGIQQLPGGATGGGLVLDSSNRTVIGSFTTGSVLRIAADQSRPAVFGQTNIAWNETSRHVAPGEIVRVYGTGFAGSGVQVLFDDTIAPLLYAGEDQIDAIVPFAVGSRNSVSLKVIAATGHSNPVGLSVVPAAPEIVANQEGFAAALNEDGSVNSSANPAAPGSVVALFVNGAGPFEPEVPDGTIATDPLPRLALPVSAMCGSGPVDVVYAGAAPGMIAGVSQINLRLGPERLLSTPYCFVTVAGGTSHGWPVWVRR